MKLHVFGRGFSSKNFTKHIDLKIFDFRKATSFLRKQVTPASARIYYYPFHLSLVFMFRETANTL